MILGWTASDGTTWCGHIHRVEERARECEQSCYGKCSNSRRLLVGATGELYTLKGNELVDSGEQPLNKEDHRWIQVHGN